MNEVNVNDALIKALVKLSRNDAETVRAQKVTSFQAWIMAIHPLLAEDASVVYDKAVNIFQNKNYARLYANMVCDTIDGCLGGRFVIKEHMLYMPFKKPMDAYVKTECADHYFSITTVPRERKAETWGNEARMLSEYNKTQSKPIWFWCIQRDQFEERVNTILQGHETIRYMTTQSENAVRTLVAKLIEHGPIPRPERSRTHRDASSRDSPDAPRLPYV